MNRLIEPLADKLTAEQTAIFDRLVAGRGRILGPYKIWIYSPTVADGMERLGTYPNKHSSLSPREVEMTILLIAQHWQSDYVVQAHLREGRSAGLPEGTAQRRLVAGRTPAFDDPHEGGVFRFADALVRGVRLSDAEFGEVEAVIGREGIAEVLVLIGYYTSVASGMKVHEVPYPQPQ